MKDRIAIGLVVPYSSDEVPAEGPEMYPDVRFVARGVGVRQLTHSGYETAMQRVMPAAAELAGEGADAIMVIGTSLTFYRGAEFNARLIEQIHGATGLPTCTMSTAVVEGLRSVGGRRVAVATAYTDEVNGYLRNFLTDSGFDVLAVEGFGLRGFTEPHEKTEQEIIVLASKVLKQAPQADALLISCGGLRTLRIASPLEDRYGIPVVSSMPAGFWAAMRLIGATGRLAGAGRLLEGAQTPVEQPSLGMP